MPLTSPFNYDFAAPRRIVFGWGRRAELSELAVRLGSQTLVVWGSRTIADSGVGDALRESLAKAGLQPVDLCTIAGEPSVADVDRAVEGAATLPLRQTVVVAVGGGSAIDLAKAVAALAAQDERRSIVDYLEGVGQGAQLARPSLPLIAMPTTAGTGSEATRNAVISGVSPPFKKSLRAEGVIPAVALVDPELTRTLPPAITAQTGMDAITQLIESFLSRRARPLPQALVRDVLPAALAALPEAVRNGQSRPAREVMAHAALVSGMALANAGLGMAHGVAAALGAHLHVAHGLACAAMLPIALKANRSTCVPRLAQLERCVLEDGAIRAAGALAATDDERAADSFIERIETLCNDLGMPRTLRELGVQPGHITQLVRDSRGSSMDGNPRTFSDAELAALLEDHL